MTVKNWYNSKTIVTNLLALLVSFAIAAGIDVGLTATVQAEIVAGFMAISNIVLRLDTDAAIGKVKKDD